MNYYREETITVASENYEELLEKVYLEINEKIKDGWELVSRMRNVSSDFLFPYKYCYTVRKYEN